MKSQSNLVRWFIRMMVLSSHPTGSPVITTFTPHSFSTKNWNDRFLKCIYIFWKFLIYNKVYYMKSIISSLYLVLSVLRQDNNLIISVSKINLVHVLAWPNYSSQSIVWDFTRWSLSFQLTDAIFSENLLAHKDK